MLQGGYIQPEGRIGVCCDKRGKSIGYKIRDVKFGCKDREIVTGLHFQVRLRVADWGQSCETFFKCLGWVFISLKFK